MGEEISAIRFKKSDYQRFTANLTAETSELKAWIAANRLNDNRAMGGFEQEAWLIDDNFRPAPLNEKFITTAQNELVSAELAKFNIELNVNPLELQGKALRNFHAELEAVWSDCGRVADLLGTRLAMIGILPTVQDDDLTLKHMSTMNRYKALNEQVMRARKGLPIKLDIVGREHLQTTHSDVMLESAATSFQIHRQMPFDKATRYFNAAIVASAFTVAAGANSPYLFGRHLWEESRIPLFEQAVEVGGYGSADRGPIRRVTFGSGYVRQSLFECFQENLDHYPVLLPVELEAPAEQLPHVRLHNGTIWRWNRPLVGFDDAGVPHVRLEHRVVSSGPTVIDEIANAAFFYGLNEWMATCDEPIENQLEHAQVKHNFYEGARLGLEAHVKWLDDKTVQIGKLICDELLDKARLGLQQLDIDPDDINDYLGIIEARVRSRQTGAYWQRSFAEHNGHNMLTLLQAYYEHQQKGRPVHEWPL
jgi:hypothetical protein